MELKKLKLTEIKPYGKNPRKNDGAVDAVAESIKQCGYCSPIVVDENYEVLAGHTRLKALKKLGRKECEVVVKEGLTEEQKQKYRILDNKTGEFAEWDLDVLQEQLKDLDFDGFDFGFEFPSFEEPLQIVEDEIPEVYDENEPTAKTGDIWQLGRHRLMCGDSTDKETVELLMNGNEADLAFQSPPYNIGKNAQLNDRDDDNKYTGYNDENTEYLMLLNATTDNAIEFAKYAAINIQMLSGNKKDFVNWLNTFCCRLCDIAIWYKDNVAPAMARRVMNSSFEFVVFFSKENQSRAIGTADFRGTMSNVYQSHIQSGNEYSEIHSATFPIAFASHYISNLTNKEDSVLDLFGGTGTTLIACEQLDRTCYMMELDERYVSVIINRYLNFTGRKDEIFCIRDGKKLTYDEVFN